MVFYDTTKQKRFEVLVQQEEWLAQQLERDLSLRSRFRKYLMNLEEVLKCSVIFPNKIRTVIQAFTDKCLTEYC